MNSQYAIAVHILALLNSSAEPLSSEFIAGSVGVNPVVVRNVTGLLRRGGLLETQRGVVGANLTRPASSISLLDVYRAVNAPETVLKLHQNPNPSCPVGAHIQGVLDQVFGQAQAALEAQLAQVYLADVTDALRQTG
ncbi:Rrf2 family transcriptional regulator [Deinococcus irradiatisoli]|uniref:Rrf2 family transcriptional regulator n=1 Tax=Deinococcus irradiatisoli TaxID=2202254 RepID=A0A2Z3JC74_9DEIO|nr:Rrf2 family transcriptional regulator [Deinococcus irradiatisoli]AWN22555.1 Rrf2 family transcriptional regulator [Deinococcus irradiatisoli]